MTVVTLILLGGVLPGSSASAENDAEYSGFLDQYPDLKHDADGSGGLIYEKPEVDHCNYDKIMIEPIEVWMADDSTYKGFSPDVLEAITDELYRSLEVNLEPEYPVVGEPGEGVLVIRVAITDVYASKRKRGFLGYMPIGAVVGAMSGRYRRINLEDATIEMELLDAQTLDRLGVLIDKLSVTRKDGEMSWEEVIKALHSYAERFRADIDADHSNC